MLSILIMFLLIFSVGILTITAGEYAIEWLGKYIKRKSLEQSEVHNSQQS